MRTRTAKDLRADAFHLLQRFDQTDAALWQKVLNAITVISADEEAMLKQRREAQKAALRRTIGILNLSDTGDWKREKEMALTEKYGG